MRLLWLFVFTISTLIAFGQIEVHPILKKSNQESNRTLKILEFTTLPFWDDFSTSDGLPGVQWEFSEAVQVTEGLPQNPPTFKSATLDGFNELGNFYSETETFSGRTDQLISKTIDLSTMAGDETIYLSFFWEAGGNGEIPEDEGDSLRLQLLNQDSIWVTTWKIGAFDVPDFENFTQEIVKITSDFRHENFRFKFETFGSQQGAFDTWHIDYVYMNSGRSTSDLTYLDRAFTGQLQSIVHPYREMPAEHFFNDPSAYLNLQNLQASNLDFAPHTLELDYELILENTGETFVFQDGSNVFLSGQIKTISLVESANIASVDPAPDSIVFTNTISSGFNDPLVPANFRVNDTIRNTLLFHDYYAFDDGTPEFAGGVRNKGSVAIQFVLGEQDTLTHFDFYFPKAISSAVGKTLTLNIWKDIDGSDPIASKNYTIKEEDINKFTRIQITNPVVVEDTIYIGYKQDTSDFLPIGLDRGNLEAKERMYYLEDGSWLANELANGILMIRPVFRPLEDIVLKSKMVSGLKVYPNPTYGFISINGEYQEIKLLSISGQILKQEQQAVHHNFSSVKSGIYLLQVVRLNGKVETFRLIKE